MLLTEQEVEQCFNESDGTWRSAYKRIEAKLLEKLKAQEPVGWYFMDDPQVVAMPGSGYFPGRTPPNDAVNLEPLYTHPPPPDDVARDAERYKWLRKVAPNMFWDNHDKEIGFVRFDTKACLWKPEMFDAAIDAAMKGGKA